MVKINNVKMTKKPMKKWSLGLKMTKNSLVNSEKQKNI